MSSFRKSASASAIVAAISLVASPVMSAELPQPIYTSGVEAAPVWKPGDDDAQRHRHWRYRRNRGVDAGDVIAGVLIIGGIAAIANAAAKNNDRRYRDRDWRYPNEDSRNGYDGANGIERAVSMCVEAIERDTRVEEVETVDRTARGWQVSGSLYDGESFTCVIGADGRIDTIDYGAGAQRYESGYDDDFEYEEREDNQYDDDYYVRARARSDIENVTQPAYPGGPLPGEDLEAYPEYDPDYRTSDG